MKRAHLLALPLLAVACKHDPAPEKAPPPAAAPAPAATKVAQVPDGWWRDDVFYEIFVRSFADSNGDGIGDLNGLTAKLDVLNDGDPNTDTDLGITGIWLMPIHPSPSYHGYDVVDYRGVNPDYGTMADLERFLAEAHKRGIRVIIDFVLNHSAKDHPWFADASSGPKARHRAWYTFRDTPDDRWKRPWDGSSVWHPTGQGDHYYGLFWSGMPDLNLSNPDTEEAMLSAMEHWLDKGMDGFRVDAVRHLFESEDGVLVDQPASHAFMKRARARIGAKYPEALLVAEAWTDSETVSKYYGDGDEFQLAFSFDAGGAIVNAARDGTKASMAQYQATASKVYKTRSFEAPFTTNHDMPRVMRQLKGDAGAARVAAATLFSLPGTPFVYYGEEIGMQGGPSGKDEDKRTPMRWSSAKGHGFSSGAELWHDADEADGVTVHGQRGQTDSLWSLYRDLIRLRRGARALTHGETKAVAMQGGGRGGFAVLRDADGARVLFVVNYHREATGPVTVAVDGAPTVLLAQGIEAPRQEADKLVFDRLGPQSFAYVRLD